MPLKRSPFPLVARIVEDTPNSRVSWEFRGFWRGDGEINLDPAGSGTLVTGYEDVSIPRLLGVGPVIEQRFLAPGFAAVWASGWKRLRRMAGSDA